MTERQKAKKRPYGLDYSAHSFKFIFDQKPKILSFDFEENKILAMDLGSFVFCTKTGIVLTFLYQVLLSY